MNFITSVKCAFLQTRVGSVSQRPMVISALCMQRKEILGGEKCPEESWKGRGGLSESLRVISQSRGKYRRRVRMGGCIYTAKPDGDALKTLGSSLGLC